MNESQSFNDRRKYPRIENNIPVKISSDEGDLVTETWNLSRTGVYCRINAFVEPMTKLKIHLLLPIKKNGKTATKKISCQGIVVRTEAVPGKMHFNAAVFFNDIQIKDADYISDYIHDEIEKKQDVDANV